MAIYSKPDFINSIWAASGDKASPSSQGVFTTAQGTEIPITTGWTQIKPPYEVENWIQNQQSQFSAYINQLGIPEWDSSTEYQAGKSYVQGSNGTLYKCISTHTNRNPAAGNPAYWEAFEGNRQATTSARGTARLATSAETQGASGGDAVVRSSDMSFFRDASNMNAGVLPNDRLTQASSSIKGIVELATSGEVDVGTDATRAVTPASLLGGLLGEALFTNNGYIEIPCVVGGVKRNLLVQWGGVSNPTNNQGVFYAKQFPTTVLQVICGLDQDGVSIGSNDRASVKDIGAIQFRASVDRASAGNMVLRYIAIGY